MTPRIRRRMRSSSIAATADRPLAIFSSAACAASSRPLARAGIVRRLEQVDQAVRHVGRLAQRLDDGGEAVGEAGLPQIAEPGAQQHDAVRLQPDRDEQLVEQVVLAPPLQHRGDDLLDHRARGP